MNLYDNISQKDLNALICGMLHNFSLSIPSNINQLNSDYCDLTFNFNDSEYISQNRNQLAGSEYIITKDFTVELSNIRYNSSVYYLKLYYYDLGDGDIDNTHDYDVLKEKIVKLSNGINTISFEEEVVYLQFDFDLIVKES